MKDRLIEKIDTFCKEKLGTQFYKNVLEMFADYLLADGWMRPPCKVGDVVYFAVEDYHDSAVIDGIHITEEGILFTWVQYEVGYELTECWDEGEFDIDEIGKTVFLTREEAEKALQEVKGK